METTPILVDLIQRGTLDVVFAVLPSAADGVRNQALPTMEMVFVGHPDLHQKEIYRPADLAELELLTFQKGSQPHVTLLDLFRKQKMELKKVHAISSISAMVQLVQGGFGVALLPRAAVTRLSGFARLRTLACEARLQALPIHASYRTDPSSRSVETVVESAMAFARRCEADSPKSGSKSVQKAPKRVAKGKP